MKPALQIRVNQQLSLTPQLQQAIRLLQLSSLELELELNTAVESNPLLEVSDGIDDDEDESDDAERGEREDDGSKSDSDSSLDASERQREDDYTSSSSESSDEDFRNERNERDDMPLDLAFERTDYAGSGSGSNHSGDEDAGDREDAATEDLRDHLFWQLNLTPMSPLDQGLQPIRAGRACDDRGRDRSGALTGAAVRSHRRRQPRPSRVPDRPAQRVRRRHRRP